MSRRRRKREIERRLRELDRLDRLHGLGATTQGGPRRARDWRGLLAFAIALVLAAGMVVAVPALVPTWLRAAVGLGPHRLAATVRPTTTGSYAFMAHQRGDRTSPVAWDPCRPIRYVVNPAGGPSDAVDLAQQAVARVSQLTGLVLEYAGESSSRPRWDSPIMPIFNNLRRPVLISWATPDEVPQLAGNVAGIGGSVPIGVGDGRLRYGTGGATLDAGSFAQLEAQSGGKLEERAIVLHELGHVLGLAHVSDPAELMNADNLGLVDFGPGDRAGLARLGKGSCF